jgi:hypothetical protein
VPVARKGEPAGGGDQEPPFGGEPGLGAAGGGADSRRP